MWFNGLGDEKWQPDTNSRQKKLRQSRLHESRIGISPNFCLINSLSSCSGPVFSFVNWSFNTVDESHLTISGSRCLLSSSNRFWSDSERKCWMTLDCGIFFVAIRIRLCGHFDSFNPDQICGICVICGVLGISAAWTAFRWAICFPASASLAWAFRVSSGLIVSPCLPYSRTCWATSIRRFV